MIMMMIQWTSAVTKSKVQSLKFRYNQGFVTDKFLYNMYN